MFKIPIAWPDSQKIQHLTQQYIIFHHPKGYGAALDAVKLHVGHDYYTLYYRIG